MERLETYGSWDVAGQLLLESHLENVKITSQGQPLSTPYICVANDSKNYQLLGFENAPTRLFTKMQNSNSIPSGSKLNDGHFFFCAETIGLGP